jgi:hypothetical protein
VEDGGGIVPDWRLLCNNKFMKQYLKFNNILGVLVIIWGLGGLLSGISLLPLLGAVYYLVTAFALFKKPVVGYILLGIAIVLFVGALIIYGYTGQY